tara:strand:+ start:241 stop:975 length:735 start_codon:yes stop_codon:yes gene_type:complete
MKISKFRDIDSYKEKEYKERVASTLDQINQQTIQNTEEVKSAIDNHITSLSNQSIDNTNNIIASVDEDLEIIKQTLSGVAPRTETTKFINQKVEEDILILETSDELFEVEGCDLIFSSTNNQKEVNQFFILDESVKDDRCQERRFNFDTDQAFAIRLDSYAGDADGFFLADGHKTNNSSDILLINDTFYKLKLRMDESKDEVSVEDGFSVEINDIEKDANLRFKRDHTISGYMLTYIVENKMNS